jgi:hypothetical protein
MRDKFASAMSREDIASRPPSEGAGPHDVEVPRPPNVPSDMGFARRFRFPRVRLPHVSLPKVNLPKVKLPRVDLSRIRLPPVLERILPAKSILRGPKPKWFLPVVGVGGLVVGIGLVGLIVSAVRSPSDASPTSTTTSTASTASGVSTSSATTSTAKASAPTTSTAPAMASTAAPPATTTAPSAMTACALGGGPHVVAPNALVASGVEVAALSDGIFLGFASADKEAMAVRLDPASLSSSATAKARATDAIRRVTPSLNAKGQLSAIVDVDHKHDNVQGRRVVPGEPPIDLGAHEGHVVWSPSRGAPAGKLWALDGEAPLDAMRGAASGTSERTLALVFRRGGNVFTGAAAGEKTLAAKGALARIDSLGTAVGSPAIALSDDVVMLAWSDRASSTDPWSLRWVRFKAGDKPGEAQRFVIPPGGIGGQAMSPALAAIPGGRFFLVWTEGPASGHQVRGMTLRSDGTPVGAPIAISSEGVNAGQGQAAVAASGAGVVAFLASSSGGGGTFELVATPITCPR